METTDDVNRWTGGITMNYNPVARFTNKFQLGLDAVNEERSRLQPFGHAYQFVPEGEKGLGFRNFRSVTAEYLGTLAFDDILPSLSSRLSFGAQGFQTVDRRNFAVGNGYSAPGVTTVRGGRVRTGDEVFEEVVQVGFFGQNRFSYLDKLYLTTGVRIDGNSAFGQNYGFQVYPNVQLSYDASNESWKPSLISNLRFRGAVGTAGLAPGAYDKFLTFTPFTTGENESGVRPNDPGNPDLGPERTTEIEAGFEAGFWNERIGLDFTVYRRVTRDAILDVALPPSLRFGNEPRRNVGEIHDEGYEVALRVTPIESSRLRWSTDLRLDGNHNEIVDLGMQADTALQKLGIYRVGFPVRHTFSRKIRGWNPTTRAFTVTDTTVFIGRTLPGFNASLGNELTFGAFRVYALVSLEQGAWFNNGTRDQSITFRTNDEYLAHVGEAGSSSCLTPVRYLDASRRLCETAASDSIFKWASAIAVQDRRDNVRLREVSLSYSLPESISAKLGLSRTMITLAGQNLQWWDKCNCLDPNVNYQGGDDDGVANGYLGTPQPRQFKLSIRTSF